MTATKNVYALMLALVIVLSGCFGMAGDESDAQDSGSDENGDDDSSSGETGSTPSGADNLPPVITATYVNNPQFTYEESDCMTSGLSLEVRHAMTDWDGSIVNAGWDVDLDGVIDYPVTADEGYTTLFMPIDAMVWRNYTDSNGDLDQTRWENSFAFGAQDDSGEWTSSSIMQINKAIWDDYGGGTWLIDNTPCDAPLPPASPNSTSNVFTAEDANAATSAATDNLLMQVRWTSAVHNLSWDYVQITLSVGDSTYNCNTAGDVECSIGQDGSDDAMWETGEFLTLSESGSDIANGATTISIHITYNGQTVAGPSSVSVS
jgi:hypothetical protein